MKVLFEDNHLIAVYKPNGVLSQGDSTGDKSMIDEVKAYIKKKYNKPGDVFLGSIHRIDRVTSGILIFARTSKALTRMNQMLKDRKISKTYLAILDERPDNPSGKLVNYLRKNQKANYVIVVDKDKEGAKKAILNYEMIAELESKCLVSVNLETGRPHQIRTQFGYIGCPVTGDTKYRGSKRSELKGGIYLHSYELQFLHPVGKAPIRITAKPDAVGYWKTFKDFI